MLPNGSCLSAKPTTAAPATPIRAGPSSSPKNFPEQAPMQFNALTLTLQNFIAAFSGGYSRLQGSVNSLLGILVGIEIVLLGLWTALGGGDNVGGVFKKILHIGAWVWIVQSYPSLCKAFVDSLVNAGLLAGGGGDVSLIMDPSRL